MLNQCSHIAKEISGKYSHILRLHQQPGVFNVQHSFQKILLGFAKIYIYGFNEDYSDTSLTA